jgi:YggT family protein
VYAWSSLIVFIAQTLDGLLTLYLYIVIISALMTWIEPNPYNPIVRFIYSITEPVFEWFRAHIPVVFGGIDFSPLLVIIVIQLIQRVVIPSAVHALIPSVYA